MSPIFAPGESGDRSVGIWLPAAGNWNNGSFNDNLNGNYWSSSYNNGTNAYNLNFNNNNGNDNVNPNNNNNRYYGQSVRPLQYLLISIVPFL
ncbi:MAG: hypothetical protein SPL35_05235 [Bacteroidales bacterium]|nr:hypothetical protein [Bacteroidales bacterium]